MKVIWGGFYVVSHSTKGKLIDYLTILPVFLVQIPDVAHKGFEANVLRKEGCYPVFLSNEVSVGHYDIYCKTALWPLFHYLVYERATNGRIEQRAWMHYQEVNQRFADKAVEIYEPGDQSIYYYYYYYYCYFRLVLL